MPSSKTSASAIDTCPLGKHCLCGSLPPRLRQVLHRFLEGKSEKQVALALGISQNTVHEHLKRLSQRFKVSGKTELMALGFRTAAAAIPPNRPRALRHDIGLTESQREDLLRLLTDGERASHRRITRAKILLRLDGGRNDYDIADELEVCSRGSSSDIVGTLYGTQLYAEQDADYNVTSLTNSSGTVVERYIYDPYGSVTVLNAGGTVLGAGMASSTVGWNFGFQDGWTDPDTGQVYFNARWVNVILGRWDQQDPDGTINGPNLYQFAGDAPDDTVDPSGEVWWKPWTWFDGPASGPTNLTAGAQATGAARQDQINAALDLADDTSGGSAANNAMTRMNGAGQAAAKSTPQMVQGAQQIAATVPGTSITGPAATPGATGAAAADAAAAGELANAGAAAAAPAEAAAGQKALAEAAQQLTQGESIAAKAAQGFGVLKCTDAASAIEQALTQAGEHGQLIIIRAPNTREGWIVSRSYDNFAEPIAKNGYHVGVQVGNMVFDNLHPNGMPYADWIKDFDAHGGVTVTRGRSF